jgi:hypothetical protein
MNRKSFWFLEANVASKLNAVAAIKASGIKSPWLRRYCLSKSTAVSEISADNLMTRKRRRNFSTSFNSLLFRQPMNNSICVMVLTANEDSRPVLCRYAIASPTPRPASINISVSTTKSVTLRHPLMLPEVAYPRAAIFQIFSVAPHANENFLLKTGRILGRTGWLGISPLCLRIPDASSSY